MPVTEQEIATVEDGVELGVELKTELGVIELDELVAGVDDTVELGVELGAELTIKLETTELEETGFGSQTWVFGLRT